MARIWFDDSDVNRLLKTFWGEPTDRVPHLEYWYGQHVPAYVLGRPPETAADWVEFARAIGMDAIPVGYGWRPGNVFERSADGTAHYVDGAKKQSRQPRKRALASSPPLAPSSTGHTSPWATTTSPSCFTMTLPSSRNLWTSSASNLSRLWKSPANIPSTSSSWRTILR